MELANASTTLASEPPRVCEQEAEVLAARLFGITGQAVVLSAERDKNFLLQGNCGKRFVLKVSNPSEDPNITDFHTSALVYLEGSSPNLALPRVVRTPDGATGVTISLKDGRTTHARMLSYLAGTPLSSLSRTARVRQNLATTLAMIDRGLAGFTHTAERHDFQWDSTNLLRLENLLGSVEQKPVRNLVENTMSSFAIHVEGVKDTLRNQVIYNDMNFHNVLMSSESPETVAGLIDFGDIIRAPLVNDVCVAASYHFLDGEDPFEPVGEFIGAYHQALPLHSSEMEIVPHLIAARMATTILVTSWRAKNYPDNSSYILRNAKVSEVGLAALSQRSKQQNCDWIAGVCGGHEGA